MLYLNFQRNVKNAPDLSDQRRIDFAVYGLNIFGGLLICIDVTIVSPISAEGAPHPGCTIGSVYSGTACEVCHVL